jgi:hypothetical protein
MLCTKLSSSALTMACFCIHPYFKLTNTYLPHVTIRYTKTGDYINKVMLLVQYLKITQVIPKLFPSSIR